MNLLVELRQENIYFLPLYFFAIESQKIAYVMPYFLYLHRIFQHLNSSKYFLVDLEINFEVFIET